LLELFFSNLGRTKLQRATTIFIEEFWGYLAFLAVSLVFFFATYELDIISLLSSPLEIATVIVIVLLARAISVYVSAYITNNFPFFKDEPDVRLSWQHILNWVDYVELYPWFLYTHFQI